MFLSKNLHASSTLGHCAFLKTPNFALDPADIPRVEAGPMSSSRMTLHLLKPDTTSRFPVSQCDARITGTGISLPSTVILDFMYGVAAYARWGSGQDIKEVMQQHFDEHYKSIPIPPASPYSSDSEGNSSSESDDPNDDEYIPNRQPRGRNHNSNISDGMLRAMDNVLALSMLLKGTTPELMAAERQRREEAEELRMQEVGRVKVQQWKQSSLLNRDIEFQSNATTSTQWKPNLLGPPLLLKGTTPELMDTERQRREEAEELCVQEAGQVKVQQWRQSSPDIEFQLHSRNLT